MITFACFSYTLVCVEWKIFSSYYKKQDATTCRENSILQILVCCPTLYYAVQYIYLKDTFECTGMRFKL